VGGGSPSIEARVLDLVGDIHGLLDLNEFREGLIVALRRVIGSDWVSLNEFGPGPEDVWSLVVPPVSEEVVHSRSDASARAWALASPDGAGPG
jgi:hypothetical protein